MTKLVHSPHGSPRLGELLAGHLASVAWQSFGAAVAFVKLSGIQHLSDALKGFGEAGGKTRIAVGVDMQGTTFEGLDLLLRSVAGDAIVTVVHNENGSSFHPKLYLFEGSQNAELILGSGNFTAGGLFKNYEAGLHLALRETTESDKAVLDDVRGRLSEWTTPDGSIVHRLTAEFLDDLLREGYVLREVEERERRARQRAEARRSNAPPRSLFGSLAVPPAPRVTRPVRPARPAIAERGRTTEVGQTTSVGRGFVMTLQQTDVGVGQTTPGKSRRSPEIFIPLAARDADPDFWGWPGEFTEDATTPKKFDRTAVRMRLGTETLQVNMMTWPAKHDFRLRSESLRSAGDVGDIIRIERAEPSAGFDYYVEVIPQGTTLYPSYLRMCSETTRNSTRKWGYYEVGGE